MFEDSYLAAIERIYRDGGWTLSHRDAKEFLALWKKEYSHFSHGADKILLSREMNRGLSMKRLRRLCRKNLLVFTAFRVHREWKTIASMLCFRRGNKDGFAEGEPKPFYYFQRDAKEWCDHQSVAWLRTEYSTAMRRAEEAARWEEYVADEQAMPRLRWLPTTSATPYEPHKALWETVRDVSDPFWLSHHPGDHWNCKCTLVQTTDPATPLPPSFATPEPQDGIDENPKGGNIFTRKHPYRCGDCGQCFANRTGRIGPVDCQNCANLRLLHQQMAGEDFDREDLWRSDTQLDGY